MNIGRATNEEILRAFPGSKISRVAESKLAPIKETPKRKTREDEYASQQEADFAEYLGLLGAAGQIRGWYHVTKPMPLCGPDPQTKRGRKYLPDFFVQWANGYEEWIEVKGKHKWEDGIVKFDWARSAYPLQHFRMVEKINGEWKTIRGDDHCG